MDQRSKMKGLGDKKLATQARNIDYT